MKYFIMHLGCQMNQSDTERIKTVLDSLGLRETTDETEAQFLGIVACSVRQKAIDKVYGKIHEWNSRKDRQNIITFVSGCILPADEVKFLQRFDLLVRPKDLHLLPDMIRQYGVVTPLSGIGLDAAEVLGGFWKVSPRYSSPYEAFVPIQNGCDKFCTFCAVPYTRGREVSRPSREILAEVESLVKQGFRSITLLGQNVNSYGLDKGGSEMGFDRLLREIGTMGPSLGNDFWVYFTSPHPRDMTPEVVRALADFPVLAKQVHLPLQSGDDKVLIRMNRNHGMDRYRRGGGNIREDLPGATLFTDIIVGFSGETDEQFENTRRAMEEFRYDMAYIAMYSPRPGAASSRWDDTVSPGEKKRRLHVLSELLQEISREKNRAYEGQVLRVLVEKPDRKGGYLSGRTEGKLLVRFPSERQDLVGRIVEVEILSTTALSMEGKLVESRQLSPV